MNDMMEPVAVETAARHFTNEELHPDLRCSLRAMGGCWMIHHPIMVQYYMPGEGTNQANRTYSSKLEQVAKAEAEEDWDTYMIFHERAYRIDVFDGIKHRLFDTNWADRGHAIASPPKKKSIQATLWELLADDVVEARKFTAR